VSRKQHPAGRTLVSASVGWSGPTALIELVNRRGSVVDFHLTGPKLGNQRVSLNGNNRAALLYDVEPGGRFTVKDDTGRILYDGVAPIQD
jgi:hypothetical protein